MQTKQAISDDIMQSEETANRVGLPDEELK